MTVALDKTIWTDEAFMALSRDEGRYEVVDGALVNMGNSGMEHGNIGIFLGGAIEFHARSHKLGVTCDSSTAFKMQSGNKRSPDVGFVAKDRLKGLKRLPKGFFEGAPDLVVEVLSPGNTVEEIHKKIVEYFENGARLIWIIHPDEQYVLVYHTPQPDQLLRTGDYLDGEGVLGGFRLPVAELFSELAFE
jgi:Uma2 family endonuclease